MIMTTKAHPPPPTISLQKLFIADVVGLGHHLCTQKAAYGE